MIAKVLNWITKQEGWKDLLLVVGVLFLLLGMAFGVYFLFIGGALLAPKAFQNLDKEDEKLDKKTEVIEQKKEKDLARLEAKNKAQKRDEQREERKIEKANEKLPSTTTAKELEDKILDGIDDVGRE